MGELVGNSFTLGLTKTHELRREWRGGGLNNRYELYEPRDGSGPSVFVKYMPQQREAARATYDLLAALDPAVQERPPAEQLYVTPRPVAHGSVPCYLAYHWIAGRELRYVLADMLDAPSAGDGASSRPAADLARAAGRALAQLHHDLAAAFATGTAPLGGLADDCPDWFTLVRPLGRGRRKAMVPAISDLGPWNIVVGSGEIVFIDLLVGRRRPADIEVGRLAYFLVDKAGSGIRRRDAVRLARSVVDGYLSVPATRRPDVSRRLCHYSAFVCGVIRNAQRLASRSGRWDRRHTVRRLGWALELGWEAARPRRRSAATQSTVVRRAGRSVVRTASGPPPL